jgi:hypothetical protein
MLFDWFTMVAQILNFLVLVWLRAFSWADLMRWLSGEASRTPSNPLMRRKPKPSGTRGVSAKNAAFDREKQACGPGPADCK